MPDGDVVHSNHAKKQREMKQAAGKRRDLKKERCMVCGEKVTEGDKVEGGYMHLACQLQSSTAPRLRRST